jgi:release factor glutamine methyltransferase
VVPTSTRKGYAALVGRLRAAGCVFAEDEARLLLAAASTSAQVEALVARRVAGEPLEHVLGWVRFCGRRILVEPGVFVPRRRTEFLVRSAVALPARVVVDLCCGSGAVGAAVAAALVGAQLHAVDIDPVAVRCARRNVVPIGGQVHAGDLFTPLPADLQGRVDLVVVNAPYVPTDAIASMPPEARLHEPRVALDGGTDGLDVHRRVAATAPQWLAPGGRLLIETSRQQASGTAALLAGAGFAVRMARSDELDATVAIGIMLL